MEKIQLEDDEVILKQVRKHWFILFVQFFTVFIGAIFPLVIVWAVNLLPAEVFSMLVIDFGNPIFVYSYTVWLLLLWMISFNIWTNYYLDIWTITNKRLIAIDQISLFHRTTGSFRLERLQDLNVEINGIIATLLDYGTLEAQTAGGSEDEFRASGLPHPRELKATILRASDELISQNPTAVHSDGT